MRTAPPSNRGRGEAIAFVRAHMDYRGEDCVLWPFSRDTRGRGMLGWNGKHYMAHRLMCEFVHGAPPTPKHEAAHSCGRGHDACINPQHLSWKTRTENQRDRYEHNRVPRRTKQRLLTVEQVKQINALAGKTPGTSIAKMFGVSPACIRRILKGDTWKGGIPHKTGFKPGDPRNIGWKKVNAINAARRQSAS